MPTQLPPVSDEFSGASLGDKRLSDRLVKVAEALAARPDQPLPSALKTEAGLEAGYRFLNNPRVTPDALLTPHFRATAERCHSVDRLLIIHDTTSFNFNGRGFGPLRGTAFGEGFFAHVALAVDGKGPRAPIGVLGVRTFERAKRPKGKRKTEEERRADNELKHWIDLVGESQVLLGSKPAIQVMDRQADSYELLAEMAEETDFVVRAAHDRVVGSDGGRVRELVENEPTLFERDVEVTARSGPGWNRKRHQPARAGRTARLSATAATTIVSRPKRLGAKSELPIALQLNVVSVRELNPPEDEGPR